VKGFYSQGNEKGSGERVVKERRAYEQVAMGGGRICKRLSKGRIGGRAMGRVSTFKQLVKPRFLHGRRCL
jgi:hypothetical protein